MKINFKIFSFILFLLLASHVNAQSCGFGCLGLSGAFAGYTMQEFKADGLNKQFSLWATENGYTGKPIEFKRMEGIRIGANIFRADFDNYFLTAKGFYQFLKEEKELPVEQNNNGNRLNSELEMNYWGVGLDFGIPVFSFLNWKIVEGGVTFYNTDLKNSVTDSENNKIEYKYSNSDVNVGYYVSTGLIIHLVKNYVSLEGSAVYNFVTVDNLQDDDGIDFVSSQVNKNLIAEGGLSATVQLNIGVPL